ncbi:MAG: hypothetical protein J7484_07095 [Microbacterium sp.]|nr:hypothetical protein [Microbacterium sp.]
MDAALEDELRTLRARAYGRDADLALDPAAAERLRELEALRASSPSEPEGSRVPDDDDAADRAALLDAIVSLGTTGASHATSDAGGRTASRTASGSDHTIAATGRPAAALPADPGLHLAEDQQPAGQSSDPDQPAAQERPAQEHPALWTPRRRTTALVAGALAVAAVASAVTWGVARIAPVATSSGAPQIATLVPSTEEPTSDELPGAEPNSPLWEFHGLTMYRGPGGMFGDDPSAECLWLWVRDGQASDSAGSGWGFTGCSAGSFPATITLPLERDGLPSELLAAFPDGRALQFVLDGDRVGVFLDGD